MHRWVACGGMLALLVAPTTAGCAGGGDDSSAAGTCEDALPATTAAETTGAPLVLYPTTAQEAADRADVNLDEVPFTLACQYEEPGLDPDELDGNPVGVYLGAPHVDDADDELVEVGGLPATVHSEEGYTYVYIEGPSRGAQVEVDGLDGADTRSLALQLGEVVAASLVED